MERTPPWAGIPACGPLLRTEDAARYLGLSRSYFHKLAARGDLPTPIKIGLKASGLPRPWLDAVISARAAGGAA
jgi:predicted DNA-binding transcriptional regulator AlpA